MRHLIVIDMQNDFIDGALANPMAKAIIPTLAETLKKYAKESVHIIFTRDTHDAATYANTKEGKWIPLHCVKDTHGWDLNTELMHTVAREGAPVDIIDKTTFGFDGWDKYLNEDDEVILTGTCSEICVDANANAIITQFPNIKVTVLEDCCAGLTKEGHEAAMAAMAAKLIKIERTTL